MESIVRTSYFSREPFKGSAHYHDCHEIIFILKGQAQICVNEAKYAAKSGDIVLFSRYENHSLKILSKEYERFVLRLNPVLEDTESLIYSLLSNRPQGFSNVFSANEDFDNFYRIFSLIVKEANERQQDFDKIQALLLNELLIYLLRRLPDFYRFSEDESFKTVSALQRRFEANYSAQYNLCDLAKELSVSVSSLSHRFKALTGSSVMDYLLSCRMAAAKSMLAKTNLSVGEIVEKCGFTDISNFSRTFKKLNGLSPTQFRNKYKI